MCGKFEEVLLYECWSIKSAEEKLFTGVVVITGTAALRSSKTVTDDKVATKCNPNWTKT